MRKISNAIWRPLSSWLTSTVIYIGISTYFDLFDYSFFYCIFSFSSNINSCAALLKCRRKLLWNSHCCLLLPPFSLIRDFGKQNTRRNISKICQSCVLLTDRIEIHQLQPLVCPSNLLYVMLIRAVIIGFRSDLSITSKTDGNFSKVSADVLFSKVAYQRKPW